MSLSSHSSLCDSKYNKNRMGGMCSYFVSRKFILQEKQDLWFIDIGLVFSLTEKNTIFFKESVSVIIS